MKVFEKNIPCPLFGEFPIVQAGDNNPSVTDFLLEFIINC